MSHTKEEILTKTKEIMIDLFELEESQLVPEAKLYEDLDIDSIDAVDLMIELRPFVGKKFSPDDFKQVRTLGDIVETTKRLLD